MDPLFPELPEALADLSDDDLQALLDEHEVALTKVETNDDEYVGGLSADEILVGLESGVAQMKAIRAEQELRVEATKAFEARKAELAAEARPAEETPELVDEAGEVLADATDDVEEDVVEDKDDEKDDEKEDEKETEVEVEVKQPEAVVASAPRVVYRRPPQPEPERNPETNTRVGQLVAAAGVDGVTAGKKLDALGFAKSLVEHVGRRSRPVKHEHGVEEKMLVASVQYDFPEEMMLIDGDHSGNARKIRAVGNPYLGVEGQQALVASGGLCAPLTPFYDIPDLAVNDRPVRDALPSFRAERGGVSVPSVSYIGDITSAITVIEESADAQGGTFATKSCQDVTCPTWTDVAVGIISHCREYGNLNARAWPEGIAHENNLTMAAHARTAEARLLDRIKSLSINVTGGAATLSAWSHLVYALTRSRSSMRYVLRLERNFTLRVLAPEWLPDLLITDQVSAQFDRFMALEEATRNLRAYGIEPTWYKDTPSTGTTQGFAAETASTIDDFPDNAQIALFPAGTFLHLDGGTLELGLVRDSTLNSTNDYQVFGETFENVARIGPTQAARWLTVTICPNGQFPALGTAISC